MEEKVKHKFKRYQAERITIYYSTGLWEENWHFSSQISKRQNQMGRDWFYLHYMIGFKIVHGAFIEYTE